MVSKNVLDNLKLIKKLDRADMLRHLLDFPSQCKEARRIGKSVKLPRRYSSFDNIVLSGLGGSAIGADLVRSYCWDHFKKPLYVNRNYTLPGFVDNNTVLFCMSYSGNTEETLSAYNEGKKKGAKRIVLTSGGKLKELAKKDKVPYIMIPGGLPPRAALGYSFFPLLYAVLKVARLRSDEKAISETISHIENLRSLLKPQSKNNIAKKISLRLKGKLPVIYGGCDHLDSVVLRFRGQIEENSKHIGFSHLFPEMNHNEIVGWENPKSMLRNTSVVLFRDKEDHPRTSLRVDITKKIISKFAGDIIEIHSKGKSLLCRMFHLIYIGDFISLYLALLNNVDPTPVEKVMYLKNKLAKVRN